MRAREFVTETRAGKISTLNQVATVGLNTFHDSERANSDYTLNRVMMAVAMADGSDKSIKMDYTSWSGKEKTAHPYTTIEQNILKQAYKAAGANWTDTNKGDMDSEEHPAVNVASPLVGFKGYPR
jgi:cation transport regulator ChaB